MQGQKVSNMYKITSIVAKSQTIDVWPSSLHATVTLMQSRGRRIRVSVKTREFCVLAFKENPSTE